MLGSCSPEEKTAMTAAVLGAGKEFGFDGSLMSTAAQVLQFSELFRLNLTGVFRGPFFRIVSFGNMHSCLDSRGLAYLFT